MNKKKTEKLDNVHYVFDELVYPELKRAISKFPSFNSSHEGFAVLLEEVDELWDEVKANNKELARKEAIQVAAMAIRYLVDV